MAVTATRISHFVDVSYNSLHVQIFWQYIKRLINLVTFRISFVK